MQSNTTNGRPKEENQSMKKVATNGHRHQQQQSARKQTDKQQSFTKARKESMVNRALSRLNRKRCNFKKRLTNRLCCAEENSSSGNNCGGSGSDDDMEHSEGQNSVATLELFKYARNRERLAIVMGILFMWYAASWQPISVFILAIMASLMGQYSKQTSWLQQVSNSSDLIQNVFPHFGATSGANRTSTPVFSGSRDSTDKLEAPPTQGVPLEMAAISHQQQGDSSDVPLLAPLYSFMTPIFDLSSGGQLGGDDQDNENIKAAVHDILQHESNQFLRKSFQINGSAFVLALTQLCAFFLGMTLITWAAKKQASRVKILYFRSCLHQEVTWFEAIDSASGSGSSLNALVEKYEDGIGMKLALLCYFLGHVGLFALTAFYQMFKLAAFCMPFVLIVGLVIVYLSKWQAVAIGQHALLAKRSLQLAEEILAAIRTVFAFNGQQKEITRYSISLQPVYRKSLIKHLYTAFNTSLSKFSIFACFACYCFYAMRLFPPYDDSPLNKATVLAVMRGAEVSIVNILISVPFMEALQQSKGSIARIYAAIERRSKINPASGRGLRPSASKWHPSISFRMVQFGYADRSGPTSPTRRSTLPFLNLPGSPGSGGPQQVSANGLAAMVDASAAASGRCANNGGVQRRQSLIDELADEISCEQRGKPALVNGGHSGGQVVAVGNSPTVNGTHLSSRVVLNNFNLDIKAGQSVALVGPSGSGKSTVLSLVQRLYDITGGQLLIGQHSSADLNVAWLRQQIGVVTQEPRLFDMSIADNIKLGLSSDADGGTTSIDQQHNNNNNKQRQRHDERRQARAMQQVVEAARAAGAHEFISSLPLGYATRVGSAGVQLSGGQKQRIAIARALIRKPKILLLDECTSALDTESEAQVQKALKAASRGRTTLIVAHRLDTIKHADLIVVMSGGQVVECGSHEELMDSSGGSKHSGGSLYKQMYEEQIKSLEKKKNRPQWTRAAQVSDKESTLTAKFAHDSGGQVTTPTELNANDLEVELASSELRHHLTKPNWIGLNGKQDKSGANFDELDSDSEYTTDHDDDDDDDGEDDELSSVQSGDDDKPSFWQLLQFVEMPRWSALAAVLVCLLGGLILPMNLIAHSYLFSAFAYNELDQLSDYLHVFGLMILSFSTFVFIVSFLQVIIPGYVGEKLSIQLRVKTMASLLDKPMFYFDMDSNSAGSLCDRLNSHISNLQSIAGTRVATMLEAISTLAAGAFFGFGQNLRLSVFCLSFALLVLITTIIESRIIERESSLQQKFDAQLAHLMADALSNIKTVASLNKERFFIDRFSEIIRQRELGTACWLVWLRTFLTSLKFVMPALSWSASMYYGCHLLVDGQIDLQTIFIVCPVVLFAVNDTFRALVFLPELLKARRSIERLYRLNREFSPEVLQTLTLAQQLEQQNRLHLEQVVACTEISANQSSSTALSAKPLALTQNAPDRLTVSTHPEDDQNADRSSAAAAAGKPKKSISFVEPPKEDRPAGENGDHDDAPSALPGSKQLINRRMSNLNSLPSYLSRRKGSRLNSLVPKTQARGRVEFRDVDFAYPNRPSALVLDGFSLSVAPGDNVALVGSSGSGKSTCVSILEKFYDYHAGQVTLEGRDLRLVDPHWVRSQIGLVSQEPTLLSYTIGDNIRYGDNSRFVSMDEVVHAARTANIHEFIMSLPDQYDTELSNSAYSSSQLSGGQRQRIAIARAMIRNAPILIFDEATSALDNRNESVVQDALDKARRGRTSLTIAHRLATVKDADKIAVLQHGKVVEVGTHDELLKLPNGHYKSLWERQEGAHWASGVETINQPA